MIDFYLGLGGIPKHWIPGYQNQYRFIFANTEIPL